MKRSIYKKGSIILLYLFWITINGYAQIVTNPDTMDVSNLSLEDLMKYKSQGVPSELEAKINSAIEVASVTPLAVRKSANIISVITQEEINRSGARDLIDILKMVPGFDFAVDVSGIVGIAVRGNWANEAKVLLRIDGMETNETVYGTLQFANRYPIDQIKRIEIIRGPGSVIYGGEAEYAVINIITKTAEDLNGLQVNAYYGQMQKALESNNYTIAIGKKFKDFSFSLSNFGGFGNRSDQVYTDIFGNSYDMSKFSAIKPLNFNLGVNYKAFSLRAMYDETSYVMRDAYDLAMQQSYVEYFKTFIIKMKYDWKITDKFSVIPKFSIKRNSPWEITSFDGTDTLEASSVLYKTLATRYKTSIVSVYNISKNIGLTSGIESFYDIGKKSNGDVFRNSNTSEVSYYNSAAFAQSIIKNRIVNLTFGARYDYNNSFGSAFVPRAGLTKRVEKFNFKVLYSNSFKAPVIENVETSLMGKIKPEKTEIWEFETGYQLNKDMFLTLNIYDITTKNTIVYFVDTSSTLEGVPDGYFNANKTGSQGIELEYKFAGKWGHLNLTYSYYTVANKPHIELYSTPHFHDHLLAFANHKITLNTIVTLSVWLLSSGQFMYFKK